jgi:hypothetical protein
MSTPSYNAQYQDSNFAMSDNDYAPLMGPVLCPMECTTDYNNPSSSLDCPSACNYYDIYSNLSNIYDTYIPPSTKSRIVPSGSVTTDFTVYNPEIINFAGQVGVQGTDLQTGSVLAKAQALSGLLAQIAMQSNYAQNARDVAERSAQAVAQTAAMYGPASATVDTQAASNAADQASGYLQAAKQLAEQVKAVSSDILRLASTAPQTAAVQNAVQLAQGSEQQASASVQVATIANNAAQEAAAASMQASNKPQESFRFLRRRANLPYQGLGNRIQAPITSFQNRVFY